MKDLTTLEAKPAPLRKDTDDVIRVGGTRVTLDSVIGAFRDGSAPEQILLKYPSLDLTDIYAVITYYLWHRDEVDAYLHERARIRGSVRQQNETRFPATGVRERLLARRAAES